jgi:hypothetical protein
LVFGVLCLLGNLVLVTNRAFRRLQRVDDGYVAENILPVTAVGLLAISLLLVSFAGMTTGLLSLRKSKRSSVPHFYW